MKTAIHPKYYPNAKVTCSCGTVFETGSTLTEITVEICSACHPFFTGEMKYVDTLGRVEKFEQLRQNAAKLQSKITKKQSKNQPEESDDIEPKTLKEMIQEVAAAQKPSNKK